MLRNAATRLVQHKGGFKSLLDVLETSNISLHSLQLAPTVGHVVSTRRASSSLKNSKDKDKNANQWSLLKSEGYKINPCNSKHHPAVVEAGIEPDANDELAVQEAYTPDSTCFGCGPAAPDGLHLKSYRIPGGLEGQITLDKKFCAFPGIINGGIITALFDCHGNWTAAISLMDKGRVPKPPLTLTKELLVTYKEPTPPDEKLVVRSEIVQVTEGTELGQKPTVQVDMTLSCKVGEHEKLLVTATGIFKKAGALRAM